MSAESTLVDYYAQRAREYERIYAKPERQEELLELKHLVRATLAGRHVLEVACGTGYWTEVAAATAASLTALDINEPVIEIARAKAPGPATVRFCVGDVYHLPAFDRRFDAALGAFLWSHIPKARIGQFLRGLRGTLAAGAVVVLFDNNFVEGSSTPISRRDAEGNTYQKRRLDNGATFEVRKNFPSEPELRAALSGFADTVEVRWLKHYWAVRCQLPLHNGGEVDASR